MGKGQQCYILSSMHLYEVNTEKNSAIMTYEFSFTGKTWTLFSTDVYTEFVERTEFYTIEILQSSNWYRWDHLQFLFNYEETIEDMTPPIMDFN